MGFKVVCYGVVPLKKVKGEWHTLLVYHHKGFWGFPKGHPEEEEAPLDAAERELWEETALSIKTLLSEEPMKEEYTFVEEGQHFDKIVYYFLAEVTGSVHLLEAELGDFRWVTLPEGEKLVSFKEAKNLFGLIQKFLNN